MKQYFIDCGPEIQSNRTDILDLENVPTWDAMWARVRCSEPLAGYTTFRIGGPADLFIPVENVRELLMAVRMALAKGMEFLLLGGGSNVLISDQGVRGLVILNRASEVYLMPPGDEGMSEQGKSGEGKGNSEAPIKLQVASGVFLGWLARVTARQGWGGLEWAVGIPGTIGGAIVQNAGAYEGCMADIVLRTTVVDVAGEVRILQREDLALKYRTSCFRDGNVSAVILSAELQLSHSSREKLALRMAQYVSRRKIAQPFLPSAGSAFKNPPGDHAARLIEAAGLKGTEMGGAMVSPQHANFIVNTGHARAMDVKNLMDRVRTVVAERFGVDLEPEIQLVGDWHGNCK